MSNRVDIDQLVRDIGDGSSEHGPITCDALKNLIEILRSGDRCNAEMTVRLTEFANRLVRPREEA